MHSRFQLLTITVAVLLTYSVMAISTGNAQSLGTNDDSKSLVMQLPNGTSVPFVLTVKHAGTLNVTIAEELASMYDKLVEEANNGNVVAARFLGRALSGCKIAFSTAQELEAAIETLHSTGFRTYGDGREPEQYRGVAINDVEIAMRKRHEYCKGISKSTALGAEMWTKKAVDGGDYSALRRWIRRIGPNNESFELWHEAFDRGFVWAAQELAVYYLSGIGGGMGGEPDYFNAYVYQTIAFKFEEAISESVEQVVGENNEAVSDQYNAVLANIASNLSSADLERAHAKIVSIMSENRNCCIIPRG